MVARPACDRIDYISKHEKKDTEERKDPQSPFFVSFCGKN